MDYKTKVALARKTIADLIEKHDLDTFVMFLTDVLVAKRDEPTDNPAERKERQRLVELASDFADAVGKTINGDE